MARYMEALTVERGGFRIKVPESWWEFDVRPESRDDSIRRMVNERVQQHPELAQYRDTYMDFLRKAAADAWKSGALYCGCMAESFGGDTPITGSVTVSMIGGRNERGEPLSNDPSVIAGQLAVKQAKKEGDSWRKVTTVDIPGSGGGTDVRHRGHRRTRRRAQPDHPGRTDADVHSRAGAAGQGRAGGGEQPGAGPGRLLLRHLRRDHVDVPVQRLTAAVARVPEKGLAYDVFGPLWAVLPWG